MSTRSITPGWESVPLEFSIDESITFLECVQRLSLFFVDTINEPLSFDDLSSVKSSKVLRPLISYLSESVHHEAIVAALLALKGHFASLEFEDDLGVNEARGYACEVVAWRFITNLSEHEAIDYLCYEISETIEEEGGEDVRTTTGQRQQRSSGDGETQPLLSTPSPSRPRPKSRMSYNRTAQDASSFQLDNDTMSRYEALNALEIATLVGAKRFLSQKVIQKVINGIWKGDIVFWETLSIHSTKKARFYNKRKADLFCRLRVPRYLKAFEVLFFASFLVLYYAVLSQKSKSYLSVTAPEILLYIWIAGFAYDEFGELQDAGWSFYFSDVWWILDVGMIAVAVAFLITRIVGLQMGSFEVIDIAFDILALEALFLFPRLCSLLSLHPYFGTLIPCLKEMTKDFVKFLSVVIILYLGFLTAFTMLARGTFTTEEMSWILIKVFFGSSYLGFDVAPQISKQLGPAIMLVFVCLTNILLITSLISLLSKSLDKILENARVEFLYGYSVYVLEASTSNRLTYYLPPLNLIPLFFRPLRLFASSEQLRGARIVLLRLTHFPHVAAIWTFENGLDYVQKRSLGRASSRALGAPSAFPNVKRTVPRPSPNSPRPLAASSTTHAASLDGSLPGRSPATALQKASAAENKNADDDTRSLVVKLGLQVEQLTAMVAQLRGELQINRQDSAGGQEE